MILAFLVASGCTSTLQPELPASLAGYEKRLAAHYTDDATAKSSIPITGSITSSKRNAILEDLVFQIDQKYFAFEAHLQKSRAEFNIAADLAAVGLGSAGALVTQGTANILAAISAGIAGGRTSIDKNYFNDLATTAIIMQMRASRSQVFEEILKGMNLGIPEYSLKAGLIDIVKYHNAGRVVGALTQLTETAAQENKSARIVVKEIKFANSDLRKRIRDWYKITGNPTRLETFLKANLPNFQSFTVVMPSSIWILSDKTPTAELQIIATEFEIPE